MTEKIIDNIINLYNKWGKSDYIGENISQIQHALQCAYLAEQDNRKNNRDNFMQNSIVLASFLHDIGHLIGLENNDVEMRDQIVMNGASLGIVGHEGIGANYLREIGFPELVCELVRGHVQAKRYLATIKPEYYNKLSDASKETMRLQGGLMTPEEINSFNSSIFPDLKIIVREYDDLGKDPNWNINEEAGIANMKKRMHVSLMHAKLFK